MMRWIFWIQTRSLLHRKLHPFLWEGNPPSRRQSRGLHAFDHQVDFDDRTLSSQTECHFRNCHPTNLYTSIFPKCPSTWLHGDFRSRLDNFGWNAVLISHHPTSSSPHHSGGTCAWVFPSAKVLKCYKRWFCSHIPLQHLGSSPKANPSKSQLQMTWCTKIFWEWLMWIGGQLENMIWKYMIL